MKRIRILLIEDNRLLREGLTMMLSEQPDTKVVASHGSADAIIKAKKIKPTVILLDLDLHSLNSMRLLGSLRKEVPAAKVIGMDLIPAEKDLIQYVQAGVSGFILKDASIDDFLRTIRSAAKGINVLPPLFNGSLLSSIVDHAARSAKTNPFASLKMTTREREVIGLIAEGLSNKEIAQRLYLAVDTVKSHVHNVLEKLALHTRLEIATFVHTNGDYLAQKD